MSLFIIQYVDPGTGSLLTQLLLSIGIGAGFYLLTLRRRLRDWFARRPGTKPTVARSPSEKVEPGEDL